VKIYWDVVFFNSAFLWIVIFFNKSYLLNFDDFAGEKEKAN